MCRSIWRECWSQNGGQPSLQQAKLSAVDLHIMDNVVIAYALLQYTYIIYKVW